jgi:hypothetical protein
MHYSDIYVPGDLMIVAHFNVTTKECCGGTCIIDYSSISPFQKAELDFPKASILQFTDWSCNDLIIRILCIPAIMKPTAVLLGE